MAVQPDQRPTDTAPSALPSDGCKLRVAATFAPAVALLLWGDVGLAQADAEDSPDFAVPEPSALTLLAVGLGGAALAQR